MKKVLLFLLFITASMGMIRLSAYCFYNWSEDEKMTIMVFPSKLEWYHPFGFYAEAKHRLEPGGSKGCWNWKEIDKKNRKKQWYWIAYKGTKLIKSRFDKKLGEGYFPIGGTIHFEGEVGGTVFEGFNIYYDGKPWKYWESPWNWPQGERPWQTYKR